ncbi:hypothetical protein Pmani_036861 [Petrolisthes manimaculis]|uniref:Uncharacterized protein n=1 Tax=Petrolisthes manimaculis TaxID=1843537 RepID=A0AAE1TP04_9EUCA|nr:hypothetical protein Pmani_036861 [Petrolisthes manimaculis]
MDVDDKRRPPPTKVTGEGRAEERGGGKEGHSIPPLYDPTTHKTLKTASQPSLTFPSPVPDPFLATLYSSGEARH